MVVAIAVLIIFIVGIRVRLNPKKATVSTVTNPWIPAADDSNAANHAYGDIDNKAVSSSSLSGLAVYETVGEIKSKVAAAMYETPIKRNAAYGHGSDSEL